jgi:hypothetical protein
MYPASDDADRPCLSSLPVPLDLAAFRLSPVVSRKAHRCPGRVTRRQHPTLEVLMHRIDPTAQLPPHVRHAAAVLVQDLFVHCAPAIPPCDC